MIAVLAQANGVGLPPPLVTAFVLLDLAIILGAARLCGRLARRIGQPTVVGEIVAGVLLGPTLLGPAVFAWSQPWPALHCDAALAAAAAQPSIGGCLFPPQARAVLGIIGQVALVLYMFLVGLELDHRAIAGRGRAIATVAVGAVALPLGLGLIIGPALYGAQFVGGFGTATQPSQLAFGLMIGAMLAVTAFPVMAHILQEKRMSRSPMGSVGIASTAVVSVLMFLAVAVARGVGEQRPVSAIGVQLLVALTFVAVLLVVVRPALAPLGRAVEARGGLSPEAFGGILALLFAVSYVADRVGIHVIPGAFLLGAIMPARDLMFAELTARLREVTVVVLLPVFLAFSGLATDFTQLGFAALGGLVLFLGAGIVGKWLGGAASARLAGLSWPEANLLGVLMNCRGLLVLVVGLIAVESGVVSGRLQVAGVLMALVTTIMTGPLFDAFSRPQVAPAAMEGRSV